MIKIFYIWNKTFNTIHRQLKIYPIFNIKKKSNKYVCWTVKEIIWTLQSTWEVRRRHDTKPSQTAKYENWQIIYKSKHKFRHSVRSLKKQRIWKKVSQPHSESRSDTQQSLKKRVEHWSYFFEEKCAEIKGKIIIQDDHSRQNNIMVDGTQEQ